MAVKSFMDRITETSEEERARLAKSPPGSMNHGLSQLPVNVLQDLEGAVVKLPRVPDVNGTLQEHSIIVAPVKVSRSGEAERQARETRGEKPHPLYDGWWECIVVASNDPRYPVGGYRVSIPEAELRRGTSMAEVLGQELVREDPDLAREAGKREVTLDGQVAEVTSPAYERSQSEHAAGTGNPRQPHSQTAEVYRCFPELNPANRQESGSAEGLDIDFQR
ncbi:hypothetical protein [Arthrobacter bambusae]|uniref:Uncharacterized protein n=1 Tax=Arthrobacter bambusae TaxID=1338426 RepID=A0AAW8DEV9_9MICC|nr:hypothetical protein [Arthrobacter bambusae]MDP9903198.1 hypothetical protein [Arthrobacter bambusae]MDQ0128808.1 hypothetical protein [Arthrobacter bambusae]MDQ0180149.1 hypothetical protein [Arthrobacter bambusae]